LQVAVIDYSQGTQLGRIIDYVQLGGLDGTRDLNAEIQANDKYGMFNTNLDAQGHLLGVYQQIYMSSHDQLIGGGAPIGQGAWNAPQIPGIPPGQQEAAQAAFFNAFLASTDGSYDGGLYQVSPTNVQVQAPYTPTVFAVQYQTWQANDPLVHYLASDLNPYTQPTKPTVNWPENVGVVNDRYMPWGRNWPTYENSVDQNPQNLSFKDPLVRQSDDWDFTTNVLPAVGWLGRTHRGTPWQSVFLKSTNVLDLVDKAGTQTISGYTTWLHLTGDGSLFDATNMAPKEDWPLFDLFTTQFDDNATRGRLSVNAAPNSFAAWSAVLSGMVALSNNLSDAAVRFGTHYQHPVSTNSPPSITNLVINPMGPDITNSPLWHIVTNIDGVRRVFRNPDGLTGAFEHKSDIMAAPLLSDQSPFLHWNNNGNLDLNQMTNGISDEMYEWLPQQVMPLLSGGDQPTRYAIYCWGQSLQPAPGGVYLGNDNFFGMVTNYQVTSETATRVVVEIQGAVTNNIQSVIKSFNILPPD